MISFETDDNSDDFLSFFFYITINKANIMPKNKGEKPKGKWQMTDDSWQLQNSTFLKEKEDVVSIDLIIINII